MAKSLKILVVDDDVDVAESLAEILEFDGHEVALAHSGEEAVRHLEEQAFDIALLDVVMPEMNGVDCLRKINELRPGTKVFMVTGYSVDELLNQAADQGALGVLFKPVAATKMREILLNCT